MVSSVQDSPKKIEGQLKSALHDPSRYFIFHANTNTYAMNQIQLDSAKGIISFNPDTVASNHRLYIERHGRDSLRMRYVKVNGDMPVLTEVHIYSPSYSFLKTDSALTMRIDQINKVDILSKNKSRSTLSRVFGLGLPAIALGVIVYSILAEPLFGLDFILI